MHTRPSLEISVIVPVFRAAEYVEEAVASALSQRETAEVILVEDGSEDSSLEVCNRIASREVKVRLLRHADGKNHGCAASRNLAIRNSRFQYIAFLDADDYYLPNRFRLARKLFNADAALDGVYEAVGMCFESEMAAKRWQAAGRQEGVTTMTRPVEPSELFASLVTGGDGSFHLDGLVVGRTVFEKAGYFDEGLVLHQDREFCIRAAAKARLMAGSLDQPVSMRRVHEHNRISAPRPYMLSYKMQLKWRYGLWRWSRANLDAAKQSMLLLLFLAAGGPPQVFGHPLPVSLYRIQRRVQLALLPLSYPFVLGKAAYWRSFLPHFAG
jgi:glycosyltransferase involved in cell wall biosynthesis